MKIALVIPGGVDRGGEHRVIPALLALMRQLTRHHEVHAFSLSRATRRDKWRWERATIHELGASAGVVPALAAIWREHRRARFDVIQSMWAGWPGAVAVLAGKLLRAPIAVHVAGGELCAIEDIGYGGQLHWYGRWRERFVLRGADAVSAASRPVLEQVARLGVRGSRIPLGVDVMAWPAGGPPRRDAGDRARLIHVASLNRVKDQATLLQAARLLAQDGVPFALDIVGEDTLGGEIQRLASRLGLDDRVVFHGFRTQAQLRPLFDAAHINLVSSRHEAGPLVLLEAAIAGVPSVSTAVGLASEWAPHAAWCVPVGDAVALAGAVRTLIGAEDQRLQLAERAQALALREDAAHGARLFEATYRRLLGS